MSDRHTERTPVAEPRHDGVREWETFVRESPADPLQHVGSVTAPSAEVATEAAERLFTEAETLWVCPSDEVTRLSTRTLGAVSESADSSTGGERA